MKSFITTALFIASFGSQAALSSDVKFVAADTSKDTNVCLVALNEGLAAAEQYIGVRGEAALEITSCNGVSVYQFVKKYKVEKIKPVKVVKYVPANSSQASELCVIAKEQGLDAVVKVIGQKAKNIYCNGTSIKNFARASTSL